MSAFYDSPTRPDGAHSIRVRGDAIFAEGRIVACDADGYAIAAADEEGLITLGRINTPLDATGEVDGARAVVFDIGVFAYNNSGGNPVTAAHYGKPVFIEDDITVTIDPGTNNVFAGICRGFTGSKVWVDMRTLPLLANFFGNNPDSNFRLSVDSSGVPTMQLWNQTQAIWQTVQLQGASGAEHLIIGA